MAAEGCDLVIGARSADDLATLAGEIAAAHGVNVEPLAIDMGDLASVDGFADAVIAAGGADILVNNGGGPPPSGALGVAPEVWRQQFEAMMLGVIRLTDRLVPGMRERRWGRVLTVASSGVVQPIPTLAISNALRAGVVLFMKTLAGEVAADGVTVNVVAPGRIWTERTDQIDAANADRQGLSQDEIRKRSIATIPVGRYGKVEEFAAVVCFLAGAPAAFVTGHVMRVDGGMIRSV